MSSTNRSSVPCSGMGSPRQCEAPCMSVGLDLIFLHVVPTDIAFIKFVFESYEGVAVVRTLDRRSAVIVVMISHDFLEIARGILESLRATVRCEEVPPPVDAETDWLVGPSAG